MWIGTMGGMAYMEDDQILPVGPREIVSAMMVDGQGQVWSGGDAGKVFRWEGANTANDRSGRRSPLWGNLGVVRRWARAYMGPELMGRLGWIEENRFTPLAG